MSLSVGIVGLTNAGKSTLFSALTKKQVNISNYPFCTIDPNVGVVEVPDEKLDKLAEISHSAKKIPTVVQFTDIAGLIRNAHKGEGLGNQFLSYIREVDAILFVVRCFLNPNVSHVEKSIDPVRDIDIVQTELMLKDLETLQKRIEKAETAVSIRGGEPRPAGQDAKTGKSFDKLRTGEVIADELEILKKLKMTLEGGKLVRQFFVENKNLFDENSTLGNENFNTLKNLQLLTSKPGIFILNSHANEISPELEKKIKDLNSEYIVANLRDECDAVKFSEEEKKELGLTESKLNQIIEKSYKILELVTFYTANNNESHAWTIKEGTRASKAAGAVHTDFEKKFICAEVIGIDKLLEIVANNPSGDPWSHAARIGKLRTEGKDYVVQNNDVILIKHGQ